jgi:lipopolysaccharide export system protein LptA
MTLRLFPALALLAVLAPAASPAQFLKSHDTNADVDVAADRIEVQDRADRAVFAGNVKVRQAGLALDAARLTVAYAGKSGGNGGVAIERLDATGGVTVRSADQVASGSYAIYDLPRRLITLIGGVRLQQAGNTVNGGRLVIDLASGRSVIDGGGTPGVANSGGRVTGHFTVARN